MKRVYAEQINKMLQDYYFNLEDNPQGQISHFSVLASGIHHLHGVAFCSDDSEATEALRPFIISVMDGEVPKPAKQEVFA